MLMEKGMDTGPILAQQKEIISPEDDTGSLTEKLFREGAHLLVTIMEQWIQRKVAPVPQDHASATLSNVLVKNDGMLDFTRPAEQLVNQIRAFQPWPGAYTTWDGKRVKILEGLYLCSEPHTTRKHPGTVIPTASTNSLAPAAIVTTRGLLGLKRIHMEGKRPVECAEFLRGYPEFVGAHLPSMS